MSWRMLPGFPEVPDHSYLTEIDGTAVRVRLLWSPRTGSWYISLEDPDGVAIVTGRRVSPGRLPLHGLGLADIVGRDEAMICDGVEPYLQDMLTDTVRVLLATSEGYTGPSATPGDYSVGD